MRVNGSRTRNHTRSWNSVPGQLCCAPPASGGTAEGVRLLAKTIIADTNALFAKDVGDVAPQGFLPDAACSFMEKASLWILGASLATSFGGVATMMSAQSTVTIAATAVGTAVVGEAIMITGIAVMTGWMLWEFTAGMRATNGSTFGLDGCR